MNNPVNWFEIATNDLERAKSFYATVFQRSFQLIEMPNSKMYMFEGGAERKGAVGALVHSDQNNPTSDGTTIYFECDDLAAELDRVVPAGGKVLFPKMSIGEFGYIAQFTDTEGNRIGLHSHQ